MEYDTHDSETRPATEVNDPLTDLMRRSARDLLRQAVEAGLQTFLDDTGDRRLPDGRRAVVRNGHQPERMLQTGIGDVPDGCPRPGIAPTLACVFIRGGAAMRPPYPDFHTPDLYA